MDKPDLTLVTDMGRVKVEAWGSNEEVASGPATAQAIDNIGQAFNKAGIEVVLQAEDDHSG